MASSLPPIKNLLLQSLSPADLELLLPYLETVELPEGEVLARVGEPLEHACFPEGGVVSIVSVAGKIRTEVGLFGLDGMAGTSLLLGTDQSPLEIFVQIGGGTALEISKARLFKALDRSKSLRQSLLLFVHCLTIQISYTSTTNKKFGIQPRLARWLLMCHDRVASDDIAITHEFLAMMLAVRRAGVTVALQGIEEAGAIRSRRGLISVVDRAQLERLADGSYGQPEEEYRRVIGKFGK